MSGNQQKHDVQLSFDVRFNENVKVYLVDWQPESIPTVIDFALFNEKDILLLSLNKNTEFDSSFFNKLSLFIMKAEDSNITNFALYFQSKKEIVTFLGQYTLQEEQMSKKDKTQIALCWNEEIDNDKTMPMIACCLSSKGIPFANKTAWAYAYLYSKIHFETILPIFEKSEDSFGGDSSTAKMFPFDLYLSSNIPAILGESDAEKRADQIKEYNSRMAHNTDQEKTWFQSYIDHILNNHLTDALAGCKTDKIKISMGSKIHVDSFYSIDFLFNNIGILDRLAYLVAKDISAEHKKCGNNKTILLIGYATHSDLLLQRINYILKQNINIFDKKNKCITSLIFKSDIDEIDTLKTSGLWEDFYRFARDHCLNDYKAHIILPIATTLSTIHKIQQIADRLTDRIACKYKIGTAKYLEFGCSFALVVSGKVDKLTKKSKSYWEDKQHNFIVINPQISPYRGKDDIKKEALNVKYYFSVPAQWKDNLADNEDEESETNKMVIGVDKTSNSPGVIFQKQRMGSDDSSSFAPWPKENEKRMKNLYGCIRYSHLSENNNHFLYSIDFKKFYDQCGEEAVRNWLDSSVKPTVKNNKEAYTIVVSPLSGNNSAFLDLTLKTVFHNEAHLLRIDIQNALKEDIGAKYSYITEEYQAYIQNGNSEKEVNVYYVDTCIVSAANLARGKQLVKALLGFPQMKCNIYRGIIVLVNRSSTDTVKNYIFDYNSNNKYVELEGHFFPYLQLEVPSYNTINGKCPGCKQVEEYSLMHKRAATPIIAKEYLRLTEKHTCRENFVYDKWLRKQIRQSPSYFMWVCRWAFCHCIDEDSEKYIDIFLQARPILDLKNVCPQTGDGQEKKKSFPIAALKKGIENHDLQIKTIDKPGHALINFVEGTILGERNYLRMYCTHRLFSELKKKPIDEYPANDKIIKQTEEIICETIISHLKYLDSPESQQLLTAAEVACNPDPSRRHAHNRFINWYKSELLISYFKVASRKQLSKYYHVRMAVFNILTRLTGRILSNAAADDAADCPSEEALIDYVSQLMDCSQGTIDNRFLPDTKITLFFTLLFRLSTLHSDFAINHVRQIYGYFTTCKRQMGETQFFLSARTCAEYGALFQPSSDEVFVKQIVKMVKWSAMSHYDESKCILIERKITNMLKENAKTMTASEGEKDTDTQGSGIINAAELMYLENTQIIYNGVERLVESLKEETKKREVDQIDVFMGNTAERMFHHIQLLTEDSVAAAVGPHKYFLRFMSEKEQKKEQEKESQNKRIENKTCKLYADMALLFLAVKKINERETPITAPYEYEQLCNYIRDIADYHQCKILSWSREAINTIATSSIYADQYKTDVSEGHFNYLHDDLPNEKMYDCINLFHVDRQMQNGAESVVQKRFCFDAKKKYTYELLMIHLPLITETVEDLYIVLYKIVQENLKKKEASTDIQKTTLALPDLFKVRNILFVRDKLGDILHRDRATLTNLIYSDNYIRRINRDIPEDPNKPQEYKLKILHMSDLHIIASHKNDYINQIKNDNELAQSNPDMILISGDVVTGNYTADALYRNYETAIDVIKEIAAAAWRIPVQHPYLARSYIRADWKKRIVISTGNHDYASMNELEAKNERRTTISGMPGNALGNTMIKFSYFINFQHQLLGMDIDNAVRYDLNTIVNYKQLDLTVININTNSGINPYRTNKVKINDEALEKVFNRYKNDFCSNAVILLHHTPIYEIDYLSDIFYLNFQVSDADLQCFKGICKKMSPDTFDRLWIELLKVIANTNNADLYPDIPKEYDKRAEMLQAFLSLIKSKSKEKYDESNLSALEYFCSVPEAQYESDDRCSMLSANFNEQIRISQADIEIYRKSFRHFLQMMKDQTNVKRFYILGGHVHEARTAIIAKNALYEYCCGIYEAPKFFGGNLTQFYDIRFTEMKTEILMHHFSTPKQIDESACPLIDTGTSNDNP